MAHHVEPMDVDSDFDNKENSLHHNNVLPFTEKGYEELDVSELNMKLRYSITPASSPMSKSYTADCLDNRSLESGGGSLNVTVSENNNLTRSLNSTMTKNDSIVKSLKSLPLQALPTEQFVDSNRGSMVLRPHDSTVTQDNANITVTVSGPSDIDENLSLPSSASSMVHTPEATTPTKEVTKSDSGSPIMRGIKSVLNMFRSSQSPIPPADSDDVVKPDIFSPGELSKLDDGHSQAVLASTPLSIHRKKETSPTKRSSPHRDSIVFNDDLETELQWKDETTILFSQERIPIHKLLYLQPQVKNKIKEVELFKPELQDDMDSTAEYMDISYNDSIRDQTMTDIQANASKAADCTLAGESDCEFVDCETTFTKNASFTVDDKDKTPTIETRLTNLTKNIEKTHENISASRLKQIILNTTQDILDATLSVTPEDLMPETVHNKDTTVTIGSANITSSVVEEFNKTSEKIDFTTTNNVKTDNLEDRNVSKIETKEIEEQKVLDQTINIINSLPITEDPNVIKTENIPVQSITLDNLNSTMTCETTVVSDEIVEDQLPRLSIDENDSNLELKFTEDNLLNETGVTPLELNSTPIIENVETAIPSPTTLNEAITMPLPTIDDIVKPSPILEAPITELPADIPLPDEDDLDKDLPDCTTVEGALPLDLVDDIQVKSETPEIIHHVPSVDNEVKLEENVNNKEESHVLTPLNTLSTEVTDNMQNQSEILNSVIVKVEQEVINAADVETEEPQNKVFDILPKDVPLLNTEGNENKVDKKPEDIETFVRTDILTESNHTGVLNVTQNHDVMPMDINESIIELKPLPDIVNQTITMSNVKNEHQVNLSEPAVLEEPVLLKENIEQTVNEVPFTEIIPETANKDVPEIVADTSKNETTNVNTEGIPIDVMNKDSSVTECCPTGNIPEVLGNVTQVKSSTISEVPANITTAVDDVKPIDVTEEKTIDEEIVLSENDSPFVSVIAEHISEMKSEEVQVKNIEDEFTTKDKVCSPPASPPIASKGYNFNFDENADPFATKTKIRLSPPLDSPSKAVEIKMSPKVKNPVPKKDMTNRRKSQPERKRPVAHKRKINSTFSGVVSDKTAEVVEKFAAGDINLELPAYIALDPSNVTIEEDKLSEASVVPEDTLNVTEEIIKSDSKIEHEHEIEPSSVDVIETESDTALSIDLKATSSSEQSAYFSAGTSSSESIHSRNVFNIPEIDDMNFNPFTTKSKMRLSPPPGSDFQNSSVYESKIISSSEPPVSPVDKPHDDVKLHSTQSILTDENIETEQMEKECLENLSNTTTSSKTTDKNATIRELNTEDEDTIEGPFLEPEDINPDDKLSDYDDENDMMQFSELPVQRNEDNLDTGELFIDAEAFEFLLNQNKSNTIADSGKESLFLKFDPLFAKRMSSVTSDGVVTSLGKIHKRQSTPTKTATPPQKEVLSPIPGPSNLNVTRDMDLNMSEDYNEDLNITVTKPMMVVPPAVNPVTPRNKSLTPNRSNRRSITFTSPAMAVIDRLLSLSGNNSHLHDTSVPVNREQNEADVALTQLRELLAEKEIHVYTLRSESKELKDRLSTLESHLKSLEGESQERLKKINDLNDRLAEKTKINKSMAAVVEEYERTIASLISETAQDKKRHAEERIKLISERDEQTAHLASMEVSFSDLHSKYEKSKQVILNCKANEDAYKKSIKEFEENLTKMQNNYELLKQHATSKLNHANHELEKMTKSHEAEVLKLNAMIKRKELHITSLEESLAQKTKANEELTAICDELINKVG